MQRTATFSVAKRVASVSILLGLCGLMALAIGCQPTRERRDTLRAANLLREELSRVVSQADRVQVEVLDGTTASRTIHMSHDDAEFTRLADALRAATAEGVIVKSPADRRLVFFVRGKGEYSFMACTIDRRIVDERLRVDGKAGTLFLASGDADVLQ